MIRKETRIINNRTHELYFDVERQAYQVAEDAINLFLENTKKLECYEDAEEQGLLLRLPCKVGTHIYILNRYWIAEGHITGIAECDDVDVACFNVYVDPDSYTIVAFDEFGTTWFLTEEEAEAALQTMQEDKR